jgi:hypothetical protein
MPCSLKRLGHLGAPDFIPAMIKGGIEIADHQDLHANLDKPKGIVFRSTWLTPK